MFLPELPIGFVGGLGGEAIDSGLNRRGGIALRHDAARYSSQQQDEKRRDTHGHPPYSRVSRKGRLAYAKARPARAASVKSSKSLRARRGKAAAAIMAALSVERPGVGKRTG